MTSIFNILHKTQAELIEFCAAELTKRGYTDVLKHDKFVFAQGDIPVMLVAHLDTVHKTLPTIYFDRKKKVIWSPDGIGGDDRCGVYAILKICETHKPYVLFTTDEEIGGQGATVFNEIFKDVPLKEYINFMIEIDRRGRNEAVFYQCDNKEFQNYILSFGFTKGIGTFTDISRIAPYFDIAAVNFSAGYYKEHTTTEHIILDDLDHTINKVIEILNDEPNHKYYDFQQLVYKRPKHESYYTLPLYVEIDWKTLEAKEWFEVYGFEKPKTLKALERTWSYKGYYYDYDY